MTSPNRDLEYPLHHAQMSHLYLHLIRAMRDDYAPGMSLPEWTGLCAIVCQVLIGHVENRPMSVSDLARFLEMSRTTVLQRLRQLCELGILERHGPNNRSQYWLAHTRNGEAFREWWQHLQFVVDTITKIENTPAP